MRRNVKELILSLLDEKETVQSSDVAAALGVTRQAAHHHLRRLVEGGELAREGAGRGARYRRSRRGRDGGPARPVRFAYATAGLREERVWEDLLAGIDELGRLPETAQGVLSYAVTELVNNAIDHSGAARVEVAVEPALGGGAMAIEVIDGGVGLFEHVRRHFGLESELHALQELSKGKLTTMAERHSGEGLFFVSRAVERFEAESGRLAWLVDNVIGDTAALEVDPPRPGTRVRVELRPAAARPLEAIFAEYSQDYAFVRTRTVIKLFEHGVRFVSRSEAKRLVSGLEKFEEVILDFAGVKGVGQGFADEVFRVWSRAHPGVVLTPVRMAPPVEFMVERARRHE